MIYSTFLYRPHEGALEAIELEKLARIGKKEAKKGHHSNKVQDPDTAAIEMVREKKFEPSIPRLLLRIYRATPCHSIQRVCSHLSNKPLKAFYRYEKKKALAARSIKFTERFTAWVEKHILDEDILAGREAEKAEKLKASIEKHGLRKAGQMGIKG